MRQKNLNKSRIKFYFEKDPTRESTSWNLNEKIINLIDTIFTSTEIELVEKCLKIF